MRTLLALLLVACHHPRPPSGPTPGTAAAGVQLFRDASGVVAQSGSQTPLCTASARGGPLWTQVDAHGVRLVCLHAAGTLGEREQREQRFQVPVVTADGAEQTLVLLFGGAHEADAVLRDDLLAAAHPEAIRLMAMPGVAGAPQLPDGPFGPLWLGLGADRPWRVERVDGRLVLRRGDVVWRDTAWQGWQRD